MATEETAECPCKIELKPMAEWVKQEDPQTCKPCMMGPVANWYWTELKERGLQSHADRIEQTVQGMKDDDVNSVINVCQELDKIKSEVDDGTRKGLLDFDCAAQSYDPTEVVEETPAP